ncbi:UDP-4-keto-6-deoxy-N-acetylglucosamine 4-aminotransferase [Streptomyces sp. SID8375]|uniref:DegT/DnrJ/EryC1/StrS family aminotransferase n=1 Tax=Streptomyces TaxID=1883 RepID=UPI0003677EFC|nr:MULTISPECIES: DegT/DnrJ/EryC1/StrS family aminotransferase [Streptomyces]MCX5449443.1 DegT/DnrJ/EryC1/StrS family aminotransferase [Streptomyces libani]MYX08300.1 UDP-4-keto-6-deoxy-N-acetylglucosamine 4-aminotransferase [Streptomyces sp. SID8375]
MNSSQELPRWPQLTEDDIEAAVAALRSNRLVGLGNSTIEEFEAVLAAGQGVEHAVAVSTGTAAVHLALHALDVGPGDEVIVPTHTFIGSASPVVYLGARPVFADVTPDTHCLDPVSVKSLITQRTKAIVAVHINGIAADMAALTAVAAEAGVPVVEDAAQALGTEIGGRPVGGFGDLACVSLFEQKVITSGGEGGAVLTNNPVHAERVRRLRSHGEGPVSGSPGMIWAHEVGYNYRLTSVQAAIGIAQHKRLGEMVEARRRNAAHLSQQLAGAEGLELPVEPPGTTHAFWKYAVRVAPGGGRRPAADVAADLRSRGVPVLLRYPFPLHKQPAFAEHQGVSLPVAERLSQELLALPSHPGLTEGHLNHIADEVRRAVAVTA